MVITGFILTRRTLETPQGNCIEIWLSTESGAVRVLTDPQKSIFFVRQTDLPACLAHLQQRQFDFRHRLLSLNTFEHQSVAGLYFKQQKQANQAKQCLKSLPIELFEEDIRLTERYLMERGIRGSCAVIGISQRNKGYISVTQAKIKKADYQPQLKVLSLDIECSAKGELYSIGLAAKDFQKVLMIGEPNSATEDHWIQWVDNEKSLIQAFVDCVQHFDPDVFVGWSVINFDFKLLNKRSRLCSVPLRLGRGGEVITLGEKSGEQSYIRISGRQVIDGIDALKTATYQFESFSLESVSQTLLDKGKQVKNVENRMAEIESNFRHNKVKLAEYNLQDCQLVLDIFDATRLMDFLVLRSQLTGLELGRTGGSVAAFLNLYLPKMHRAGYVSPNRPENGGLASPGGYVMRSRPGLYNNVLVLDFKSLYPSIIRTFKIDPVGLVEGLQHPDKAIPGFKGACFSRHQHFLPQIIEYLWQQRDQAKQDQDSARSQAIKILMNSFYGVLGSGGCPLYDTRLASSITLRGHEIMQITAQWIEEQGYQVIYGDTDSTFVWLGDQLSLPDAQQIGRDLEKTINQAWRQYLQDHFQLECHLEIEFESCFRRFVMPTIRGSEMGSKKRYAGVQVMGDTEQLVFKGLETVRSDWTPLARQFQTHLYQLVFDDLPVADYVIDTVKALLQGKIDDQLIYRKRLRRPLSSYVKNVPPHIRAARIAEQNQQSAKQQDNTTFNFQRRTHIEYLITLNGAEPIQYQTSPIDHQHYIDKQLKPIAEGILHFIGLSFDQIDAQQLSLFTSG